LHRINNHFSGGSGYLSHLLFGLSSLCILSVVLLCTVFFACSDGEAVRPEKLSATGTASSIDPYYIDRLDFHIDTRYSKIKSHPGGGGVFIVRLAHARAMPRDFSLFLESPAELRARIDIDETGGPYGIAEISIHPDQLIDIGVHPLTLYAANSNVTGAVELKVDVINWPVGNPEAANIKRDEFVEWLEDEHPEFGQFTGRDWFSYLTYPGILVVEHWTFLDPDWEMRICFHVMIPPYDWSMLLLRPRGQWDPILAAMRESDGTTYEIPIDEYPTFYSY
jgi:hypothetical protein